MLGSKRWLGHSVATVTLGGKVMWVGAGRGHEVDLRVNESEPGAGVLTLCLSFLWSISLPVQETGPWKELQPKYLEIIGT